MLQQKYFEKNDDELSLEDQGGSIKQRIESLLELNSVSDKGFNPINFQAAISHVVENNQKKNAKGLLDLLTNAMGETLEKALVEGPLEDGDVPSKSGRDELVAIGLMVGIAGKGGDKLNAATMDAVHLRNTADIKIKTDDDE